MIALCVTTLLLTQTPVGRPLPEWATTERLLSKVEPLRRLAAGPDRGPAVDPRPKNSAVTWGGQRNRNVQLTAGSEVMLFDRETGELVGYLRSGAVYPASTQVEGNVLLKQVEAYVKYLKEEKTLKISPQWSALPTTLVTLQPMANGVPYGAPYAHELRFETATGRLLSLRRGQSVELPADAPGTLASQETLRMRAVETFLRHREMGQYLSFKVGKSAWVRADFVDRLPSDGHLEFVNTTNKKDQDLADRGIPVLNVTVGVSRTNRSDFVDSAAYIELDPITTVPRFTTYRDLVGMLIGLVRKDTPMPEKLKGESFELKFNRKVVPAEWVGLTDSRSIFPTEVEGILVCTNYAFPIRVDSKAGQGYVQLKGNTYLVKLGEPK